jgi:hypothetical protein
MEMAFSRIEDRPREGILEMDASGRIWLQAPFPELMLARPEMLEQIGFEPSLGWLEFEASNGEPIRYRIWGFRSDDGMLLLERILAQ